MFFYINIKHSHLDKIKLLYYSKIMKASTKSFLIDYILGHKYGRYCGYTFVDLFKMYSALEISGLSDINSAVVDFCDFIENHYHLVTCADPEYTKRLPIKVKAVKYHFYNKFNIREKGDQKRFASIVETLAPNKKRTRALDVGASEFPYSSIIMASHFDHTTAMDRRFYLSEESLHSMDVDPLEKLFNAETDISNHDFIVGRFPCSAIEPIVKVCAKNNKPYFIELCQCKLPWPKDLPAGEYFGWENVLPAWDPHVKVVDGFATNIDATASQISKIISNQNFKKIFDLRSSAPNRIFIDNGVAYTGNISAEEEPIR